MSEQGKQPLIVGCAQLSDHGEPTPPEMLAAVARSALEDSGRAAPLLAALDSIGVVDAISWPVPDPARAIATAIGAERAETVRTVTSGIAPIELLADACEGIRAGERRAALIAGVECIDVLMRAGKEGRDPGFPQQPAESEPDRVIGELGETSHSVERDAGLIAPVAYYPLFESAIRAASGRGPAQHQAHLGELWSRFAAVAATNPHAWSREPRTAAEIATPSASNRPVSVPYTKLMNSNIQTNQAAALLLCSAELAAEAGIEPRRRVEVRATATASDHAFATGRQRLDRSPAMAACARAALGHAGLEIDAIRHLDIYSCFPSAVEVACAELGIEQLDPDRPLTVTGGLSFAGGPGSNYVTHSLAALVGKLRNEGGHALATGVGWYLSKHGVVLLSGAGGAGPGRFEHLHPQAEVDAAPGRAIATPPPSGEEAIEAYTALYSRSGEPDLGIATFLLAGGARTVAKADDATTLAALIEQDPLGRVARFEDGGRFRLAAGGA